MSWQDEHERYIEQQVQGYLELTEESLLNRFDKKLYFELPIILKAMLRRCDPHKSVAILAQALEKGTHDPYFIKEYLGKAIVLIDPSFAENPSPEDKRVLLEKAKAVL